MNLPGKIFNFVAFELAWLAAVSGGASGRGWTGSLPALAVVVVHLLTVRQGWVKEAQLIAAVTVLGFVVETGFINAQLIDYAGSAGSAFPPLWIVALWFGFGTLPNASLAWLKGRWFLQSMLGLIAGPLTYWGGVKLGAASLPEASGSALFFLGLAWALAMPAIFLLAETLAPQNAPRR